MKLSGPRLLEGVVTGLIVAAIGYAALELWRRLHPATQATQGLFYGGAPTPQVTDSAAGTTTYWG